MYLWEIAYRSMNQMHAEKICVCVDKMIMIKETMIKHEHFHLKRNPESVLTIHMVNNKKVSYHVKPPQ